MAIQESLVGDVTIVDISGRLWGESEGDSLSDIFMNLKTQDCCKVVVDMREVLLINSSGLGSLIAGLKSFRDAGGDLKLANVSERILTILRITKLDQVFETYESREEAVCSFSAS